MNTADNSRPEAQPYTTWAVPTLLIGEIQSLRRERDQLRSEVEELKQNVSGLQDRNEELLKDYENLVLRFTESKNSAASSRKKRSFWRRLLGS